MLLGARTVVSPLKWQSLATKIRLKKAFRKTRMKLRCKIYTYFRMHNRWKSLIKLKRKTVFYCNKNRLIKLPSKMTLSMLLAVMIHTKHGQLLRRETLCKIALMMYFLSRIRSNLLLFLNTSLVKTKRKRTQFQKNFTMQMWMLTLSTWVQMQLILTSLHKFTPPPNLKNAPKSLLRGVNTRAQISFL